VQSSGTIIVDVEDGVVELVVDVLAKEAFFGVRRVASLTAGLAYFTIS